MVAAAAAKDHWKRNQIQSFPFRGTNGRDAQREVSLAHEAAGVAVPGDAERDAVTEEVPEDRADGGVEDVLQEDVLDVLRADGTGAEHSETGLHEEHKRGGEKEEDGVVGGRKAHDRSRVLLDSEHTAIRGLVALAEDGDCDASSMGREGGNRIARQRLDRRPAVARASSAVRPRRNFGGTGKKRKGQGPESNRAENARARCEDARSSSPRARKGSIEARYRLFHRAGRIDRDDRATPRATIARAISGDDSVNFPGERSRARSGATREGSGGGNAPAASASPEAARAALSAAVHHEAMVMNTCAWEVRARVNAANQSIPAGFCNENWKSASLRA